VPLPLPLPLLRKYMCVDVDGVEATLRPPGDWVNDAFKLVFH
jgi:hypothetical protein